MEETNRLNENNRKPGRRFFCRIALAAVVLAVGAAGIIFLDRHLPQVTTEDGTEHVTSDGSYLLYHTEELFDALSDDAVSEIVIPEGIHVILPSVLLRKKLTVGSGAVLEVGFLDIGGDGYVNVKGTLDARDDMIRMNGSDTRLAVASGGTLYFNENTILWCDSDRNLVTAAGADCYGTNDAKNLLLSEEDTFGDATVVSTKEELTAALLKTKPVEILSDITIDTDVVFSCPVYVCEGAALRTTENGSILVESDLFVNAGTMEGGIFLRDDAFLLNLGSIAAEDFSAEQTAQIYNVGSVAVRGWSQYGASCFNYGNMEITTGDETAADVAALTITNAGRLYNYGYVDAGENAIVTNNGWIENAGYFTLENNAVLENNVFLNRGQFESSVSAAIDEQSGIYYGNGEYRINGLSSVAVWKTADVKLSETGSEASTEAEFRAALLDNETELITVISPIALTEDIEITKPVIVRAALTAEQSVTVLLKNTYMLLQGGGRLTQASLRMENSLLVCEEGNADFTGVDVSLDNRSSLCADSGDVILTDAAVELKKKSVLSMPFEKNARLDGATFTLESSCLMINRAEKSIDALIFLEKESSLSIYAQDTVWYESNITSDESSAVY